MKEKQRIIIEHFLNGKSIRQISKITEISRPTVTKYIRGYKAVLEQKSKPNKIFEQDILESPKYSKRNRSKRKLNKKITARIDALLLKNAEHRKHNRFKQQLKKIDIYEKVSEEGHDIGYTTVCNYINNQNKKSKETFIKQNYAPGSECEFDWGEVKLIIDNNPVKLQLALFTSANSNYHFAKLFTHQNTLCFQEAHTDFFWKIGSVYKTMVYDNMKVALRRVVGKRKKEATNGLLQLSMYYLFDFRFCNFYKGNEKGHVERGIEYVRRKSFSLKTSFKNIEEANKYLEQKVDKLNKKKRSGFSHSPFELFLEEKKVMHKSKPKFSYSEKLACKVDKFSTISYKSNHYSVPESYNGKMVDIRIFANKIDIYDGLNFLCRHQKKIGVHKWSLSLTHYLKTLSKKPGAVKNSVSFSQSDEKLKIIYEKYFNEKSKEFVELLIYMKEKNKTISEIELVIKKLQRLSSKEISLDKIKMLSENKIEVHQTKKDGKIERYFLNLISDIKDVFDKNSLDYKETLK